MTPQGIPSAERPRSRALTPHMCKEVDLVIAAIEHGNPELDFPNAGSILSWYREGKSQRFGDERIEEARLKDIACVERLLGVFASHPDAARGLCEAQLVRSVRRLEAISRDMTENEAEEILDMFDTREAVHELRELLMSLSGNMADIDDRIAEVDEVLRSHESWLKGLASPFYDARISRKPAEYWWWH